MNWNSLAALEPRALLVILVAGLISIAILCGFCYEFAKLKATNKRKERLLDLEEKMIERGMSAEGIERVLRADSDYQTFKSIARDLTDRLLACPRAARRVDKDDAERSGARRTR